MTPSNHPHPCSCSELLFDNWCTVYSIFLLLFLFIFLINFPLDESRTGEVLALDCRNRPDFQSSSVCACVLNPECDYPSALISSWNSVCFITHESSPASSRTICFVLSAGRTYDQCSVRFVGNWAIECARKWHHLHHHHHRAHWFHWRLSVGGYQRSVSIS